MDRVRGSYGGGALSATVLLSRAELDADELWIEGDRFHHLFRVRRLAAAEEVRLTDGEGRARWAEIAEIRAQRARLMLGAEAPRNEPLREIHLAVATMRASRASWLVEKGTELGVRSFCFFSCERAPRRVRAPAIERLQRVASAALEQSQRSILPSVVSGLTLATLEERLGSCERSVLLDPRAPKPLRDSAGGSWWLVVGPEGGFNSEETVRLEAATTVSARLGPTILRIETAALAASAALLLASESWE